MPITVTAVDEAYDAKGDRIKAVDREVDVTAAVVELDLHTKSRQAFTNNRAYLAIAAPTNAQVVAQVRALTRQTQALIRLAVARDLLADETVD